MNTSKISIIVPVYKVEKYLRCCLDSIVNQTFTDYECLLVDDGSPDNSGKICDEYAKKDERFRVFHQNNHGVSSARNVGIKNSICNYIMFVDADDALNNTMIESMMKKAIHTNSDCCLCGINNYSDEYNFSEKWTYPEGVYNKRQLSNILLTMFTNPFIGGPVSKIYKKDILIQNNISFEVGESFAEDFVFNLKYYQYIERITILESTFYQRRVDNPFSLSKVYRQQIPLWNRKKMVFELWNNTLSILSNGEQNDSILIQKFAVKSIMDICVSTDENEKKYISTIIKDTDVIISNAKVIKSYNMIKLLHKCGKVFLFFIVKKIMSNPTFLDNNFLKKLNK